MFLSTMKSNDYRLNVLKIFGGLTQTRTDLTISWLDGRQREKPESITT